MEGASRFLHRVWRLVGDHLALVLGAAPVDAALLDEPARELRRQVHRTIRKVTDDIEDRFQFNTAIAAIMELVNAIAAWSGKGEHPAVLREALETVVRLLGPFVPHFAEELWLELGHQQGLETAGLAGLRRRGGRRVVDIDRCAGQRQGSRQGHRAGRC